MITKYQNLVSAFCPPPNLVNSLAQRLEKSFCTLLFGCVLFIVIPNCDRQGRRIISNLKNY